MKDYCAWLNMHDSAHIVVEREQDVWKIYSHGQVVAKALNSRDALWTLLCGLSPKDSLDYKRIKAVGMGSMDSWECKFVTSTNHSNVYYVSRKGKYKLTDITRVVDGVTLYRIKAIKDFGNIRAGAIGGFVQSVENLSQEGNCWVYNDACVYGKALVTNDATIWNQSTVYGCAKVHGYAAVRDYAEVFEYAVVADHANVRHESVISGNTVIFGQANIQDKSIVKGSSAISDNVLLLGTTTVIDSNVGGRARILDGYISPTQSYLTIGPLGSRRDTLTAYKNTEGTIVVTTGCFYGNIAKFTKAVENTHKEYPQIRDEYLRAVDYIIKELT